MPGATQKTWNTVVSLLFLALSLTYTAFSTYQTFTGSNLSEEEARGSINAASVSRPPRRPLGVAHKPGLDDHSIVERRTHR